MKKFEMLNLICKDCELTAKEKLVAQYFVYKSNKAGACYPCVATIAEECSVSARTVQRATKKLAEKSYIIKEERFKLGRQTSNLYTFNILLLEEIEREKECDLEEVGINEKKIEIVNLEDLFYEEIPSASEIEEKQEEEWIDFDELVAASFEEHNVGEEDFNVLFEVQETEIVASVPGSRESIQERQRVVSFSIAMQIISFICTFSEPRIVGQYIVCIVVLKHNCIIINPGFLLYQENGASIKVMGAFFPP